MEHSEHGFSFARIPVSYHGTSRSAHCVCGVISMTLFDVERGNTQETVYFDESVIIF